ncbi:MAG: flagellar hook-basal body complex protein FliE [Buchnera aphidicola (Periphyllus acericola)]|uniref:flagellar hook-basal body complex protein FliE n=1 Tax=Buchnera aphidicola TaxID=9 RepID=UPI0030D1ED20|nr:flagellar hook-basal body complex protein FliE [Buchnera aphidicola (Periphyllus acericola)]
MLINKLNYLSHIQKIHKKINFQKKKNILDKTFSIHLKNSLKKLQNKKINNESKLNLENSKNFFNKLLINLSNSKSSLEITIQIRNQIISTYHEIMNIQI